MLSKRTAIFCFSHKYSKIKALRPGRSPFSTVMKILPQFSVGSCYPPEASSKGGDKIYKEHRKPASPSRGRTKSRSGRDSKTVSKSAMLMCSVRCHVNGSASAYGGTQ